jgi:3',5'-cyclic AMP phosphodiesterase CpdA
MPANFIALSDLHLGYELSVLDDPTAQDRVVAALADLCHGSTDRLILNGDCFEACVPKDAGKYDPFGFSPHMAQTARSFFGKLTSKIQVESLVILWGNHDYALWKRVAASCGVKTYTNGTRGDVLLKHDGQVLAGAASFLDDVLGEAADSFARVRSAYPNYILGRYWPYLAFHHGHFLDGLVIGQESEAEYFGLRVLMGQGRPTVIVGGDETVASIHQKTEAFIAALWDYNSRAREIEWAIIRRGDARIACPHYPALPLGSSVAHPEIFYDDLGKYVEWYVNVLMADDTTPPPISSSAMPSYLFVGHDHLGGVKDVLGMDGKAWRVVNTGGWTSDNEHHGLHCHATIWLPDEDAPAAYCLRV